MRTRRSTRGDVRLLRMVPGRSVLHRLWPGTKLLAVLAVGIAMSIQPSWPAEAVLAGLLALSVLVARIPWGAVPRVPRWAAAAILVGAALALVAGGRPSIHLGGLTIGFGSLEVWLRFLVLTALLLLASAIVAWTTPIAELAPALGQLAAPFRRLRAPVDEVVAVVALSVRCLPLLVDELRTLHGARRVRRPEGPRGLDARVNDGVDLLVCAMVAATRRAHEMAAAIEARGGFGPTTGFGTRPGWLDLAAALVVASAVAGILIV